MIVEFDRSFEKWLAKIDNNAVRFMRLDGNSEQTVRYSGWRIVLNET